MIIFVEGPRACGKTYLIENFIKQCTDRRVEYYKFYFADHIKTLALGDLDKSASIHYFSLGNIMTIMEMNQREQYRDKVWIFDRAILTAYTWAILRGRLTEDRANDECFSLINSDLYKNCRTILIDVENQTKDKGRTKDMFDGMHSTESELWRLLDLAETNVEQLADSTKGNYLEFITNHFDDASQEKFNGLCSALIGQPNK